MPGGASQDELRSHPGTYVPKSSRATGPSQANGVVSTCPPPWLENPGLAEAVGLEVYLSGLSGERCERGTGATRNRTTEIQPSGEPHDQCRCIELYALSVRFAETRLPVGSGPSRSGRRSNPVVQLSALHWLFRRTSGRLAEWFPRDTVPIHPAGKGCQGFNRLFPAENPVSQAEQGSIEKRDHHKATKNSWSFCVFFVSFVVNSGDCHER